MLCSHTPGHQIKERNQEGTTRRLHRYRRKWKVQVHTSRHRRNARFRRSDFRGHHFPFRKTQQSFADLRCGHSSKIHGSTATRYHKIT